MAESIAQEAVSPEQHELACSRLLLSLQQNINIIERYIDAEDNGALGADDLKQFETMLSDMISLINLLLNSCDQYLSAEQKQAFKDYRGRLIGKQRSLQGVENKAKATQENSALRDGGNFILSFILLILQGLGSLFLPQQGQFQS